MTKQTAQLPVKNRSGAYVAALSVLPMWLAYFIGSNTGGTIEDIIFYLVIMLGLSTVLPVYYVTKVERGNLASLGVHGTWLKRSVAASLFLGLGSLFYFFELAHTAGLTGNGAYLLLAWSLLMFWEVLFVFGWLQNQFTKAFGSLPGMALTATAFTVFHIGSVPAEALFAMFTTGIVFSAIYRLFKMNLLVLWPFAWGVGIAISMVQGGDASMETIRAWEVFAAAAVLLLQGLIIRSAFKYPSRTKPK